MLLYISNLPFDIRLARIRKLIADECYIDDVILDKLINDKNGKRVTVGLVDQVQASVVMAKINGYFLDGRQLQVELVQKNQNPQPVIKTFEQVAQPVLNNLSMFLPQPVNPVNSNMNSFNTMPYYMAQQSFSTTPRQLAPQANPFPSFNKQNPSNWYATNFGSQQYGLSASQIDQTIQNANPQNTQKWSHDSANNPEKRQRDSNSSSGDYSFGRGRSDDRSRSRSHQRDHDRDRSDDRGRNRDRDDGDGGRSDRGRHRSRDDRYNSRDDRQNGRDNGYSRNDRQRNRDDRYSSRDRFYPDVHNDSRRHHDDSFNNRSYDSERSTFDNNQSGPRRVVWEQRLFKDQSFNNSSPHKIQPFAANPSPQNNAQNFNPQGFNNQPIFNKLMLSNTQPNQPRFGNQQNVNEPHSSNKQPNYKPQGSDRFYHAINQPNASKPNQKTSKPLSKRERSSIQHYATTSVHSHLMKTYEVDYPSMVKLRSLCTSRVKQIMEQHGSTAVQEIKTHYYRMYPIDTDQELKDIVRESQNSKQAAPKSTAPISQPKNIPTKPSTAPQASTSHAPPKAIPAPKPGPSGVIPSLQPQTADQKLPKYPNADKNVYRELKKNEQLEAKEDFMYNVDEKYCVAINYEVEKMREVAINACKVDNNENTEKVRQEIIRNGVDKVLKALKMQVSKRLSNKFMASVRVHFNQKPDKAALERVLRPYGVVSLKRSERAKFFVATVNCADGFDRLLAQGFVEVSGVLVTIKPLNILGKAAKSDLVEKYQTNLDKMAKVFSRTNQRPFIQDNSNKHDESFSDDVEIIDNGADEVVEIPDDCDFSEDIIEVKKTCDMKKQETATSEHESQTENSKEESETNIVREESVDKLVVEDSVNPVSQETVTEESDVCIVQDSADIASQETVNLTEESNDKDVEVDSENAAHFESANLTEESNDKCITQESGAELKSDILSAIDDDDLEDF